MSTQTQTTQQHTILNYSAFKYDLWKPFGVAYYLNYVPSIVQLMEKNLHIKPKLFQSLDAFSLFYFDVNKLAENLKQPPKILWHKLIQKTLVDENYLKLNKLTQNSVELSIIAGYQFLKSIFQYAKKNPQFKFNNLMQQPQDQQFEQEAEQVVKQALEQAMSLVEEYKEMRDEVAYGISILPGGHGFNLEALSAINFLEKPDDFRRKVQLLRSLIQAFKFFTKAIPTSFEHQQIEYSSGSVCGVTLLHDIKQIVDLLPTELAYPKALLTLRLITQSAIVRARSASLTPVVFLDKSGSMAESLSFYEKIPKISAGAGLALALYRKFNAKIFLFDTEVVEVNPKEVINTLMRIQADGGTNIEEVLRKIQSMPRNNLYIVISDGICDVPEDLAKSVAQTHKVVFCVLPPSWEYNWLRYFKVVRVQRMQDLVKALTV